MVNTAAKIVTTPTEDIEFSFERFVLARGMSFKYDYSVEMGLEWFECFDEAKERYETYGMDGLMDYYDPDGHSLYGRVLG